MKPSRYNAFFEVADGAILGYNTVSAALVALSEAEYRAIETFYADSTEAVFDQSDFARLYDELCHLGMLVPDDLDEKARIRCIHEAVRANTHNLNLTLMPTLDCNFRCRYCYSYIRHSRMSLEVQDALTSFVEARLPEVSALSIAWYGGEPTLALETITRLARHLHDLASRYGVAFGDDSIVTNGYLLTRRVAARLKAAGVKHAQVTLDGDRSVHDARRPLASGSPTFDRILHNLSDACELLDLRVRINVDRDNAEGAIGALDALAEAGLHEKVRPYFGHVKQYTNACGDISGTCLTDKEFSELNFELTKQALLRGFRGFSFPEARFGGACGVSRSGSFVVDPEGWLFKCWAEASRGPEWSIGSVLTIDRTPQQQANERFYLNSEPFDDEMCSDCRLLPLCMGGCAYTRRRHDQHDCSNFRHVLGKTLALASVLTVPRIRQNTGDLCPGKEGRACRANNDQPGLA